MTQELYKKQPKEFKLQGKEHSDKPESYAEDQDKKKTKLFASE